MEEGTKERGANGRQVPWMEKGAYSKTQPRKGEQHSGAGGPIDLLGASEGRK